MKKLIHYILISMLILGGLAPSYADLGIADTTPGSTYKAKCGVKLKPCNINFSGERLTIDNNGGITRDQLSSVVTTRTCRQRSILLPMLRSCFEGQYDRDITITYTGTDDSKKSALIVFRPGYLQQGDEAYSNFIREIQVWMHDVIRPVGPSIELRH